MIRKASTYCGDTETHLILRTRTGANVKASKVVQGVMEDDAYKYIIELKCKVLHYMYCCVAARSDVTRQVFL